MIDRRIFIGALTATLVGAHGQALPQKTEKLPRVGVLVSASPSHPFADAFRRGLQPLGYVEGENIVIEWRYTEGRSDRAAALAADRCHRRPFHTGGQSRHGSHPDDPDRHGAGWRTRAKRLYRQLGPPGGNVTGLSGMDAELGGKRLQLLREVIPNLARVAVLASSVSTDPFSRPFVDDMQAAATIAGIRLGPVLVDGPGDFENAFTTMAKAEA